VSQPPPVGTVTLFFSDIEGSTAAWEHFGDAYAPLLTAHYEILTEAFRRHRGYPVRTEGDSFFAAFAIASDAVRCATAVQQALARYPWPEEIGPIRVRIGLHTGEPRFTDGDYYGPTVNRAARVQAAAHGGQVLLSAATHQLASAEMGT
jgi:class 3 adenylate cyclase